MVKQQKGRSSFESAAFLYKTGAGERTRTVDSHLGKVALYQLSYARVPMKRLYINS